LPWLNKYAFSVEEKYETEIFANKSYDEFINELIKQGTTRVSMFATIHKNSTKILIEKLRKSGLGAYVGKVNMDRNSSPNLMEQTNNSILDTIEIVEWINKTKRKMI
jgi:guanine deaminase